MDTEFIIGNFYSKEIIEQCGFIETKRTSLVVFFRKKETLMAFNVPKPKVPNVYKLISVNID